MSPRDILIVGELNPYGDDPKMALYPYPREASGNRLREILGLSDNDYIAISRANLCVGKWSMRRARVRAEELRHHHSVIITLGRKVAMAFGFRDVEFFSSVDDHSSLFFRGTKIVFLPHPSGRNRVWNDPATVVAARGIVKFACPDLRIPVSIHNTEAGIVVGPAEDDE